MLSIKKQWAVAALCTSTSAAMLFAQTPATESDYSDCAFVKKVALPNQQLAVVYNSSLEPCSIGSFVVAIYSTRNRKPKYNTDDYSFGIIEKRDGTIENASVENLGGKATQALVVQSRSVGTGGYISAYAFVVTKNTVRLVAKAEGLGPDADYVAALRKQIKGN